MTAETSRAVQTLVPRQAVKHRMIVRRIIINTGPPTAWYSARKSGHTACRHRAEVRNFLLCQSLSILIWIARRYDILCRSNQRHSTNVWPQVNLARQVKPDSV
jgi:hypothetical protein